MMKVTKLNHIKIREAIKYLISNYELDEIDDDEIRLGNAKIYIPFPRESITHTIDEFVKYIDEYSSLEIIDNTTVKTNRFTQKVVLSSAKPINYIYDEINLEYDNLNSIKIRLIENPILIGLAASKIGVYDKYATPCSSYHAVEIEYKSQHHRLPHTEEEKILNSYLFELSFRVKDAIVYSKISESGYYDDYEEKSKISVKLNDLMEFNDGMQLYTKALTTYDTEIVFIYFYKIIEYYSPIVSRITSYELMTKKLDSIKTQNLTSDFLKSIFSLAQSYNLSQSDGELASTVLSECVDVVELYKYLPSTIQKKISKAVQFENGSIDYSFSKEKLLAISNLIGKILYSTRNQIVHAKSNYQSNNFECPPENLAELNNFLSIATYNIIRWYSRLPTHLK